MRHAKTKKRITEPDKKFQSRIVTKFVNKIMKDGKKTVAQKAFYEAMDIVAKQNANPLEIVEKAVQAVAPRQEVKARRIGGASYQIPIEVRGDRKTSLAIRWLIASARSRSSKEYHTFAEKLAAELLDAIQNRGEAVKKRDTVQRMADANRAFSHFRW